MAKRKGRPSKAQLRKAGKRAARRLRRDAFGRWLELRTRPAPRRRRG